MENFQNENGPRVEKGAKTLGQIFVLDVIT